MTIPTSTVSALTSTTGLPIVNQALEPASVRDGSPATRRAYATALGFEQMLVQQLSQSLAQTGALGGGEAAEEGSGEQGSGEGGASVGGFSAGAGALSSLLPQALTGGVMSAGGLGLARQLTNDLAPPAAAAAADGAPSLGATGGTPAAGAEAAADGQPAPGAAAQPGLVASAPAVIQPGLTGGTNA